MSFLFNRMHIWLWISAALFLILLIIAPQQIPVSLYKIALITTAAWVAYWIDCTLFPYARPDAFLPKPFSVGAPFIEVPIGNYITSNAMNPVLLMPFALVMLRRALIIAAAMIAVALGA